MIRRAFAANIIPALILWSFAFGMLWMYNHNTTAKTALDDLATLKSQLGFLFSMPAQAIAAAFLPYVFQSLQKGDHRKIKLAHVPFLMLMTSVMGGMSDVFYTFQAWLFGDSPEFAVVLKKMGVDLFGYCPLVVMPLMVLIYAFKDNYFSFQKTRVALGKGWYVAKVVPVWLAALMVWGPTLFVLYQLPLALQFPFQAIVQCFWGLVLVVLTDSSPKHAKSV